MNKSPVRFLLLFFGLVFCACREKTEELVTENPRPHVLTAIPEVISPSADPVVVEVDESRLQKQNAGNPEVVLTNTNVHTAGTPVVVKAGAPIVSVPGSGSWTAPEVKPAIDTLRIPATSPAPASSLPFRMKDAASYNMQYLDVDQGLSSSYIWDIYEDHRGNMWFATDGGGVTRYDGKTFFHYTEQNGLASNYVRSILEDKNGNLWFATITGVSKYDGTAFTNYTSQQGLNQNSMWASTEDRNGNIWFATYGGGVCRYDGKNFTHYSTEQGLPSNSAWAILEDHSGAIWIGTNGGGVVRFDGKSFATFTTKQGLCDNTVLSIFEDKDGRLWFGTNNGLSIYDGNTFTNYTTEQGLSFPIIREIWEDADHNMWIGTYGGGFMKYDGKSFTWYTHNEGLSDDHVVAFHEDETGNLWLGTYGGGITKFNPNSFQHFTDKEGLNNFYIWTIGEDTAGNIWMGTNGGGVVSYDEHSFRYFRTDQGLAGNIVRTLLCDHTGNLWFGCYGQGISRYDGKTFTNYTEKDGLANNAVLDIVEDQTGKLWFATDGGGVSCFDGKSFTTYTTRQGLPSNYVRALTADGKGLIWIGTNAGLCSLNTANGTVTQYKCEEQSSLFSIWSLCKDAHDNLWMGTGGFGVIMFDGKSFAYYTGDQGLSNNSVWSIVRDRMGSLWLGTEKGLNYLMVPGDPQQQFIEFHREDGLKAEDFYLNSAFLDSKNRMWWGTGKSLSVLNLYDYSEQARIPSVQLNAISIKESFVDFRNINDSLSPVRSAGIRHDSIAPFQNIPDHLELPYNQNHLTFNFGAIEWSAQQAIRYQYRLEGLDQGWSQLTTDNKADYRNIPYGTYTFKVKAQSRVGLWSAPLEYSFVINPPWWHTWWARTSGVLVLIGCIVLYIRARTRTLRARQIELQRKVNEATFEIKQQKHLIEEKHKAITDSINYAERIQRSFLATKELLDRNLKDYFVLYLPKDVVSGDFYWASTLPNGNFALVTADSTGHGVPGAIMSLLNITSLEKACESENDPAKILNETRRIIIDRLKKDGTEEGGWDGMDCSFISFNFNERTMRISAANNPVWILRDGAINEVKPDRFPVGRHELDDRSFTAQDLAITKGDVIYTMTDGFADQFGGPLGKKYKWKQLQKFLLTITDEPMHLQKEKLHTAFKDWKNDLEQIDDICIIGIRISE